MSETHSFLKQFMAEMKVMFLGRGSGKSTLLARKMYGVFIDATFPTFEELFRLSVNVRGTSVELYVYDIDGSDNFSEATRSNIAETAAFLASDKASYITGQVIKVDGGMIL